MAYHSAGWRAGGNREVALWGRRCRLPTEVYPAETDFCDRTYLLLLDLSGSRGGAIHLGFRFGFHLYRGLGVRFALRLRLGLRDPRQFAADRNGHGRRPFERRSRARRRRDRARRLGGR